MNQTTTPPPQALPADRSLAELIHDRVVAEGGVLHVWYRGAKFRKFSGSTIDIGSPFRVVKDPSFDEKMEELEVFVPSQNLRSVITRNIVELRDYLERARVDWCKENGIEA